MTFAMQQFSVTFFMILAQPFDDKETLQWKVRSSPDHNVAIPTMPYRSLSTSRLSGFLPLSQQPHNKWIQQQILQPYRWGNMLHNHIFINQSSPEGVLQGQSWNSLRVKSHIAFRHNQFVNQVATPKK